jgi:hypothetical protein
MMGSILDKEVQGWVWGWRCANCGFLLDPRIVRLRPTPEASEETPTASGTPSP